MAEENPLISLYGEDAFDLVLNKIKVLAVNSNIPFDKKYINLGISFLMIKANEIIKEEKKKCTLHSLVCESFGEAAIYKYNCNGGVL